MAKMTKTKNHGDFCGFVRNTRAVFGRTVFELVEIHIYIHLFSFQCKKTTKRFLFNAQILMGFITKKPFKHEH